MKRRAYLGALALSAATAGCLGDQYPSVDTGTGGSHGGGSGDVSVGEAQIDTTPTPDPLPPPVTDSRLRPRDGPTADTDAIEIAIHEQVNGVRQEHDLPLFLLSDGARSSAQTHSRDMAHEGYFDHTDPQGQNFIPSGCDRPEENLFRYEGVDAGPRRIARTAVWAWMQSEEHRSNILNPQLSRHGIGAAKSSDGWVYVTQLLCG